MVWALCAWPVILLREDLLRERRRTMERERAEEIKGNGMREKSEGEDGEMDEKRANGGEQESEV